MFFRPAMYQFGALGAVYVVAAGIAGAVALLLWRRRDLIGAGYLLWLEVAAGVWSLAVAFQLAALPIPLKIFWTKVSCLGISSAPVFFFLFAAEFGQQSHWFTPRRIAALFVLPALFVLAAFTNDFHGLVWQEVWLRGESAWAAYEMGPFMWVIGAYEYCLVVAGIFFLLQAQRLFPDFYRMHNAFILVGVLLPLAGNLIDLFGRTPMPGVQFTPMAFALSGVILALGILCFRVLDVVPIARKQVVEAMSEGIAVVDAVGRIVDVNPAACGICSAPVGELIGRRAAEVFAPWYDQMLSQVAGQNGVEVQIFPDGGPSRWLEVQSSAIRDTRNRLWGRLLLLRDISARKIVEIRLTHMAATDELTGLYNRRRFFELARAEFSRAQRYGSPMTVFLLDIDHFKKVNDEYGHDAGDIALRAVAVCIANQLRSLDVLGRLGGEEFVVLLPETHQAEAEQIAERIRSVIEQTPIPLPKKHIFTTVSIGVAEYTEDIQDIDTLISRADAAMYRAKRNGRNRVCRTGPRAEG
ncbi:MAG: diguanylate cyclase [Thermodesulfobacteriota bacterium]